MARGISFGSFNTDFSSGQPLLVFSARWEKMFSPKVNQNELQRTMLTAQRRATEAVGNRALKTIKYWLSPGTRRQRLGFTGRAAAGLSLQVEKDETGWFVASIVEDTQVHWLPYIREGWPKSVKAQAGISQLVDWVKARRLRWKTRVGGGKTIRPPKKRSKRPLQLAHRIAYNVRQGKASEWMASGRYSKAGRNRFFDFYTHYATKYAEQQLVYQANKEVLAGLFPRYEEAASRILFASFSELTGKATKNRSIFTNG